MNKYFKSDIEDSLNVLQQEREEQFLYNLVNFYVKYYHIKTRGYYSIKNELVETFYYNNELLYWMNLETKEYTAFTNPERGYYAPMDSSFEYNLYYNTKFAMDYIKNNPGNLVFIRTNNYKELVGQNTYNYRVKFFDEEGSRIKELHAFATKDYCVNAYKNWHHHSFEVVDLSSYKYIYAVSYKDMNEAVAYGDTEVNVVPFDPLVHFDTLTINWGRASFIRLDEEEEFVDLSNEWQVVATNEPIHSVSIDKNAE